jgi:MSHA biogenesis protein MshM
MINAMLGITKVPFFQSENKLLTQQQEIFEVIKIHSQQGGLCVVTGNPGVGKSVLKEHIENLRENGDTAVLSFSQTMHSYNKILLQIAESMKLDVSASKIEKSIRENAFKEVQQRKTLITVIDEAHLIDMHSLRKLRLLFDQFPKKHNLVLFGQPELMHRLSMKDNEDIKSRITFSRNMLPMEDSDLGQFILGELESVGLGAHTIDEAATNLILRSVQGNIRLCCNLCYGALLESCQDGEKIVNTRHVNAVLLQPHWRSHDDLIKKQVKR